MINQGPVNVWTWMFCLAAAIGTCEAWAQELPAASPASEMGKELRQLERDVTEKPARAIPPAKDVLKLTKPEEPAKPEAAFGSEGGGRLVKELQVLGDASILQDTTLWDVAQDYIEGRGAGINHLLAVTNESPRTRSERTRAVTAKIQDAARRIGFAAPARANLSSARTVAMGQTLGSLLKREIEGKTLTMIKADEIASRYEAALRDRGYYLASLIPLPDRFSEGVIVLEADQGRLGKIRFFAAGEKDRPPAERKAYSGRHFTEGQLRHKTRDLAYGRRFDYFDIYRTFYAINAHPDLSMDGDIVVSRDDTKSPPRRYGNLDLFVRDELPVHGVISVANSGTESTGEWRPSIMLQHLNLTRHDDVFTLGLGPVSDDIKSLLSFGINYYVPYSWKQGGGFTVYGGYSELDAQEVVQGIGVEGRGWFAGAQVMHRIRSTRDSITSVGAGLTCRYIEDQLILNDETGNRVPLEDRPLTLLPISFMMSHSSLAADALGGRNFFTLQWIAHVDGLGVSDAEEFESVRAEASPDYHILRAQAARLQPVFGNMSVSEDGRRRERVREWLLFLRADAQWASDVLVPVEQKAIGGMDSVRGFPERVVLGDHGISATVELRTPMLTGTNLGRWTHRISGSKEPGKPGSPTEGLQLVAFVDGGSVWVEDSYSAEDSFTMASTGLGLRLMLGQSAQIRFDWGVPIAGRSKVEEASQEDVPSSGCFHLSAQVQF